MSGLVVKIKGSLPLLPRPDAPISAAEMERVETDIIKTLPTIRDISEADNWRRKAKAIESYLRSPEMQRPILGAQRRIEGRIGQLLGPAEKGGRGKLSTVPDSLISADDRSDFRLIARALDGECELDAVEWRKSRRSLVALIREKLGLTTETPVLPEGVFSCISADPPWQVTTGPEVFHGTGEKGNEHIGYQQMSIEAICGLMDTSGKSVTECFADDAHLYLWTINKYVEASYRVARAWGFEPRTLLTWCKKPRGIGLGGTFKLTTEFILFATRGKLEALRAIPTTWFEWPRGRHSEKPEDAYKLFASVTPGNGLALFERKERSGWVCWGNEYDASMGL